MYKGLVSGNDNDKIGLLWFCKTCLVNIRGFIRSSSARPLTQTNEDSPKGLSQRSPNSEISEILKSEQGNTNSIKSNPSTSKNDKQEWKTVKNSSKRAVKSHIVETKNKYSILGRLEDSVGCEFTVVQDSKMKE